MAGVLVLGGLSEGRFDRAMLQVAGAAAPLAAALGEPLMGALIGAGLDAAAQEFQCGQTALYLVEGGHLDRYDTEATVQAALAVIEASGAHVVLVAHSGAAREWVPTLAARLQAALVMNCCALDLEDGVLVATKPVNGGSVLARFAMSGSPGLVTVRASDFAPLALGAPGEVRRLPLAAPASQRVTVLSEELAGAVGGPRLKEAKLIVSGGRGVGSPDNWHHITAAAAALGAAVGCSRPVADSGWVASSHQVGLSGTTVAPDLYIAVGISGAPQHLAGITAAKTVVAINNSADAEIFKRADLGVVGDYQEVLQGFVERVRQLRS